MKYKNDGLGLPTQKTIVIIEDPNCRYCKLAKELCVSKNLDFISFTEDEDRYKTKYKTIISDKIQLLRNADIETLNKWGRCTIDNNYNCFPKVFINDEFIGGYTELQKRI
jgi:glutaredoxin